MSDFGKKLSVKFSDLLHFNLSKKIVGKRTIFPFYHTISNEQLPHIKHLYKVKTEKDFIADLDFLLKNYKPINYFEFIENLKNGKKTDKNTFLLSFDDGLRECYTTIAPILKKKGVPAIFFLNSDFIDNKKLFYRYKVSLIINEIGKNKNLEKKIEKILSENNLLIDNVLKSLNKINYLNKNILDKIATEINIDFDNFLLTQKPYISTSEIKSIISEGFAIGSHSLNHPKYNLIPENEQIRQTIEDSEKICDDFNLNYQTFAFPFTDFGVKKSFFKKISPKFEATFGTAGLKNDEIKNHFQRIPMENSNLSGEKIVKSEYFYFLMKSVLRKNRIKRDE